MVLSRFFSKINKGNNGEDFVITSITKLLKNVENGNNFFLLPKVKVPDLTKSVEIDVLLLHPTLGIYVIEVKNWNSLDMLNESNNPFEQVNVYKNLLMSFIKEKIGKLPINIEARVIFPSIEIKDANEFFKNNQYYLNYKNTIFFKDDLEDINLFQRFFSSSSSILPNKKEFMEIASLLMDKENLKKNKIIPVITKDEVLFFDYKQLSILNGYTGGFRIIRGVAGTGKTIILANFVQNKLNMDDSYKFLILCFNKKLAGSIKDAIDSKYNKNVAVYSLYQLLNRIGYDYKKVGIDKDKMSLDKQFELFKSKKSTIEFKEKFHKHLSQHPIDYFLCDETQDMPPNFMRVIYEEIGDCIFFIDEAQKFYKYSMDSIAEVFHHPDFEKISMRGRVKNLKNVYRTPSNIAKCAFEILSMDKGLNDYYKKSFYLQNGFLSDVNFILENGSIKVYDLSYGNIKKFIDSIDEQTIILTHYKNSVKELQSYIKSTGKDGLVEVMTLQSVKGLEAKNIVLHDFDKFLEKIAESEEEILYRKVYVLLTRALDNIHIFLENEDKLIKNPKLKHIIETIKRYEKLEEEQRQNQKNEAKKDNVNFNLAKLKPSLSQAKEVGEIVVVASELFAIVSKLFGG